MATSGVQNPEEEVPSTAAKVPQTEPTAPMGWKSREGHQAQESPKPTAWRTLEELQTARTTRTDSSKAGPEATRTAPAEATRAPRTSEPQSKGRPQQPQNL